MNGKRFSGVEILKALLNGKKIRGKDWVSPRYIEINSDAQLVDNTGELANGWFDAWEDYYYEYSPTDRAITIKQSEIDQLKQKIAELEQRAK